MSNSIPPIPPGYHSLQAYLVLRDAAQAIQLYQQIFGATEQVRMNYPGSDKVMHAELKIGDSILMLGEEVPEMNIHSPAKYGGSPVSLMHYVTDVDAVFARATAAGCTPVMPPTDMFWGDRFGKFIDPFGHVWSVATHIADPTPEEIEEGAKKCFGTGEAAPV